MSDKGSSENRRWSALTSNVDEAITSVSARNYLSLFEMHGGVFCVCEEETVSHISKKKMRPSTHTFGTGIIAIKRKREDRGSAWDTLMWKLVYTWLLSASLSRLNQLSEGLYFILFLGVQYNKSFHSFKENICQTNLTWKAYHHSSPTSDNLSNWMWDGRICFSCSLTSLWS